MKNNPFRNLVILCCAIVAALVFIGSDDAMSHPRCIKSGCDNYQAVGSAYCYKHEPSDTKSSSYNSSSRYRRSSGSTYKGSSGSSYSTKSRTTNHDSSSYSTKSYSTKSYTTKKKSYDSYDDGYDDVYMDGDYDYDRYNRDSDYADGVDDAMEDDDEDW